MNDEYRAIIENTLEKLGQARVIERIWARDYTVWKPEPVEISNRLGWLDIAGAMMGNLAEIEAFVDGVRQDGYTQALLLGMGGSSLAPEMFRRVFGVGTGYLELWVLDSTDPGRVLEFARKLEPGKTLYIVSTKSGGTVETFSFFRYFYHQVAGILGGEQAGRHFAAITDPGSKLEETAKQFGFRKTFLNDPNIGGRYSALSYFGLVPARLVGVRLEKLLQSALDMAERCRDDVGDGRNPAASLGGYMGGLALEGRDKLTLITSPKLRSFGDWAEQLVAESTGKEGRSILPVVGEQMGEAAEYMADRVFVALSLDGEETDQTRLDNLEKAGYPVMRLNLQNAYDLGGQIFLWELATAVAGHILKVNPFDQPDVEAAKALARQMVAEYQKDGRLPESQPILESRGVRVYGDLRAARVVEAWEKFLGQAEEGAYIAVQAYLPPTEANDQKLQRIQSDLREKTRLAVTLGYGPRFLHSTGQLHKGDAGKGLFVQITADHEEDASIPDEVGGESTSMSFGVLEKAQALGDYEALRKRGRKVIRFHIAKAGLRGIFP